MENGVGGKGESVARPLNSNFAFLALEAAVELDDIIHGKVSSGDAVIELVKSLRETTSEIGGSSLTSLADPLSADLLNRALEQSSSPPISTVESLIRRANDVASSLQKARRGSGVEELENLRNFCLALSQVTSAYQQEERERTRPQHPQRR
jgi:hypothetical protein